MPEHIRGLYYDPARRRFGFIFHSGHASLRRADSIRRVLRARGFNNTEISLLKQAARMMAT